MPKNSFITGLDIGTSAIKILIVQKKPSDENFEVIYCGQRPSLGIRRGVIVDTEEVAKGISSVVQDAELGTGLKIESFYANIGGSHIFCAMSHGLVSVSRADEKISEEDISRVMQAAQTISLSSNKEIIDVYPREFIVDGEGGVKDATGMKGVRLEVEALIVAGFSPYLRNLDQCVLKADFRMMNRTPSVIASARSVLTAQQKELGVALLDIGAGTSSLAVYEEGDLIHLAVFPVGSANITNDLAIGLKTDVETAERIKIEKGTCIFKGTVKKTKTDSSRTKEPVESVKTMSKIIQDRVSEIFDLANKELKKISKEKKLPSGIVLTGGGVKLSKIEDLAKKEFKLTCQIGEPCGFLNLDNDPSLAAVCGLALEGVEAEEEERRSRFFQDAGKDWGGKIKKFFKIFVP